MRNTPPPRDDPVDCAYISSDEPFKRAIERALQLAGENAVEALRNEWGGAGAEDLRTIAINLIDRKNLQYNKRRLGTDRLKR
jgi:hypothetical protein